MNFDISDTRQRIKAEAGMLLMKYGLRSMSMDDIAAHLGMSKKQFTCIIQIKKNW